MTMPSNRSVGVKPVSSPSNQIARHQSIENALCLALYYVRHSEHPSNIHAATVKAIRAASMLKQACSDVVFGEEA